MTVKKWLPNRAAMWATAATGATFFILSIPAWAFHPAKIPMVTAEVSRGSVISPQDIRWVTANQLPAFTAEGSKWAKENLIPGEILTSAMVSSRRIALGGEKVAVVPAGASDLQVASVGGKVDVVIASSHGVIWSSGPVVVLSLPASGNAVLGGGNLSDSGLTVLMSPDQAFQFEQNKLKGAVVLLGVAS